MSMRTGFGTVLLALATILVTLPSLAAAGSARGLGDTVPASATASGLVVASDERGAPRRIEAHAPEDASADGSSHADEEPHAAAHSGGHGAELGTELGLVWIVPFVGILLSIAIFPLVAARFWHEHYPKVTFVWAVVLAVPFLWFHGQDALHAILHIYLIDYVPFIILLWGLFTVAGGLVVRGSLRGTPTVNTLLLAIGTVLASWVGTTGAAMILIRPVLRANAQRKNKTHVIVFFIFLVANIGGSLTPLGDPPLFLGFLHGVPFSWTLIHMPLPMLLVSGMLLAAFFVIDSVQLRREGELPDPDGPRQPFAIVGLHNLLLLAGIVGSVLMSGLLDAGSVHVLGIELQVQNIIRDVLIVGIGLLSLRTTKRRYRRENKFTWAPIREVGYLFAGIFMTIVPALEILKAGERGALAGLIRWVDAPWQYFWVTGSLSGFLDNAPTYLTFFSTALGSFFPGMAEPEAVALLIEQQNIYLLAISTGAVFMGACTYIGNAPNFMVKSIAEEAGIEMPSFFGYLLWWTLPFLLPTFVVVTLVFFRP
ncbi:MAG: sodium:proton antiporter [Acidobacteriota bacterium]|nr:sodium:proton antiporter [Acidobacteriota bacterium]